MLKFLRKYRTLMLGMFIVILMVAFVAPQAIQQLGPNPLKQKAGEIGGEPITMGDLQRAAAEVQVLDNISPAVPFLIGLDASRRPEHWMLLKHEAERAGMIGEGEDGADWLPEIAGHMARLSISRQYGQYGSQIVGMMLQNPEVQQQIAADAQAMRARVASAAGNSRLSEQDGLRALAAARGIMRLKDAYVFAARPTPAQTVSTARRLGDSATIDYLFLRGSLLEGEIEEPTEEQLRAHYEKYADAEPGTGEFGIGYRRSSRIKVEWLKVDRASIVGVLPVDRVELRKLYESNRAKYPSDYEVEREIVRADYLEAKANEIVTEIVRIVRAEVLKSTRKLEEDGAYKKLPEGWSAERPALDRIAQTIVDSVKTTRGVTIPLPTVESRDANWMDADALGALPGIGGATVRLGNVQAPFPQYAMQVRELEGNPSLGLQVGLTQIDAPAEDAARNLYFVTVLDARPASAPDSMAEVTTLREDWKAIKGYERLVAEQGVYETLARTDSLDAVARLLDADGTRFLEPLRGVNLTREGAATADPNIDDQAFRDAAMDAAARLDPRLTPEAIASDPGSVVSAAIPSRLGVAIAKVREIRPMTIEQFRRSAVGIVMQATALEAGDASEAIDARNPFTYEAMVKRLGFVPAREDKKSADS